MTTLVIFVGVYLFVVSPVVVIAYVWYQSREQRGRMVFFLLLSLALAYAFGLLASALYYNPLPYVVGNFIPIIAHVPDNGFPSHHALFTAVLAAVATIWNRKLGAALWIIALFVGAARVYGGVHHSIDIFAAAILAVVATGISLFVTRSKSRD